MLGQSKTAYQAEIDAACELIDFWRFNACYAQQLYERAADQRAGRVEPARVPAARGLRLRGHAVQLHGDRRQPADRAGADGQHGGVEAGRDARSTRRTYLMKLLEEAGLPPGVINFVPGSGARDRRRRCSAHRDLAGIHFTGSTAVFHDDVEDGRREHRPLPHLPAHRRRDRRQGLHRRPPLGRSRGAGGRDRARRLRVPGTEVLGGVAASTSPRIALAARSASALATEVREIKDGRRRPTSGTSWAR